MKANMDTQAFWDDLFENGKEFVPMNEVLLDRIFDRLGELRGAPPETALELACGAGQLTGLVAKRGLRVKGLDISEAALTKARERLAESSELGERVTFERRDLNDVDGGGESETVDLVLMKLAIAFVKDRSRFLQYVRASLQPGGVFVLMTPVLVDGYDHDDFTKMISVPLEETQEILEQEFGRVEIFDRSYWGGTGMDMTFLLSNP